MTYYNWPVRRGQDHPFSILKDDQVIDIKKLIKKGISDKEIAKRYKVTSSCISQIRRNKRWSHVSIDSKSVNKEE